MKICNIKIAWGTMIQQRTYAEQQLFMETTNRTAFVVADKSVFSRDNKVRNPKVVVLEMKIDKNEFLERYTTLI